MSRHLALLLLAMMAFTTPALANPKALFDNAHAETAGNADWEIDDQQPIPSPAQSGIGPATARTYWQGAISSYGVDLVKRGYTVHTNIGTITYGNSGNTYDLANYDVFIVPEPNTLFSAAEVTAILNFVQNGGGLIAISDHSGSDRNSDGQDSPMIWNALDPTHSLFGVHWGVAADANNNIVQTSANVAPSTSDSITHGPEGAVTGLAFHNGTTFTLYPGSNPTVRGEVWMTGLAQTSTTGVMAASCQYGSGRVFMIGDSSPVDDGSAVPGNTSIFDGWGEASGADSVLFLNATLWATRRGGGANDTQAPIATLTSPVGGETWKAGSVHAITWTATDNVGVTSVDLAYSTDGGATYPNAIATGLSNSGTYNWTVPNVPGAQNRVIVTAHDAANLAGLSTSAGNFTIDRWTIVASAGANGTITPSGTLQQADGTSRTFTIAASANYHIADVLVDGVSVGAVASYPFTAIHANHTIAASFAIDTRTITASAGAGGSITPSGTVTVNYGANQSFAIAADGGYHVSDVLVNGASVGAVTAYAFTGVTANQTIAASFTQDAAFTITTAAVGGGSVAKSPNLATYTAGQSVQLSASANPGFAFTGWSGDTTGVMTPITVTVTRSLSYTATFADTALPVIALLSPQGNDAWVYGSTQPVTWSASDNVGVASVTIEYSTSGEGGPWLPVASGLPNTGSYDWTVPAPATPTAVVRVTALDAAGNSSVDTSTTVFAILDPSAGVGHGPAVLALARPTPNPSGDLSAIAFSLPKEGRARVEVLDAGGRRVASYEGVFAAGSHLWQWDGRLASGARARAGLYFVRLGTAFGTRMQRLVRLD
jgi:uncharacterized repeat protein (TIGR02543 family)